MAIRTMTEELLSAWLSGELDPAARREVSRWLVTNTQAEVPTVLRGILRARETQARDAALSARGPREARRVSAWNNAFARGGADWGAPAGLLAASLDATAPALRLDGAFAVLGPPLGVEVAAYLEVEGVLRAWGPARATGAERVPVAAPEGSRPTLWVVWGADLPRASDAADELDAALGVAVVRALRWDA